MTVIYELNRCQADDGGRSGVIVSEGTYTDYYDVGEPMLVPASSPPSTPLKAIDVAGAKIGLPRFFATRTYRPSVMAIASDFEGCVFVHNGPQALPLFRKRAPRCKLYLYAHNDLLRTYSRAEADRLLSYADGVICVSDYIRRVTADAAPAASGKLHVVLNGVNPDVFIPPASPPNNPKPVILCVGRVVPEKGAHVLIRAARLLAEEGLPFTVRIVGSQGFTDKDPLSEYERSLRKEAEPISDDVEFLPFTARDEIMQTYQSGDIYVVPSTWHDPCPLIVIEAMGIGLPVAAAMRGGIPEQGADAAEYFDPDYPDELARILVRWLKDPTLRQQVGRRCRARAETLDWRLTYNSIKNAIAAD